MGHAVQDIAVSAPEPDQRRYRVGRDEEGRWIAVEIHGLGGGLFISQAAALRYAGSETRHRPGAVSAETVPLRLVWSQGVLVALPPAPTPTGF